MVNGTVVANGGGQCQVRLADGQTISVAASELPESARKEGAHIAVSFGGDARELLNHLLQIG